MKTYGKTSKGVISGYYVVPSARWNLKGKSGVAKNMLRNSRKKRLLRITMKRIRRQELKKELNLNLQDIELAEIVKAIES